ncbi:XRE family transcriptional regulator [Comamonas thiooxydans]|uniref:ImmA/IrrE family metallo-endopeptidase n=1 Tax=Comamonas thiooxydans TaxID=363952 RepID=UPI001E5077E9|nr:ImmA/IrrE family metallo-endopeptidase [Comamonas thiooxydans]BDB72293.1 XRE family transcriptional regulator [Comamonas thiooxydans]
MNTFEPNWATPPGATVLDLLQERQVPLSELAHQAQKTVRSVSRLIHGVEPLTEDWARCLSMMLGATPAFWLRREQTYRADLQRLCEATEQAPKDWLSDVPLKDLARLGWIEKGATADETALNACAFFGVTTSSSFQAKYQRVFNAAAYRKSDAYTTQPFAVAAWLRQGEILASEVNCEKWNQAKLIGSLDSIRELTLEADPAVFLPALEKILASAGVAMVVARTPSGCRASGATRFLNPEQALMQLSFRYLADDQFWFTVFHEIGHLLLHAHSELFLEDLEDRNSDAEREADSFALKTLFAKVDVEILNTVEPSLRSIKRLARNAGISDGIVVGQLQRLKRVPYNHFNKLKIYYAWDD